MVAQDVQATLDPTTAGLTFDAQATVDELTGVDLADPTRLWDHIVGIDDQDPVTTVDAKKLAASIDGLGAALQLLPVDGTIVYVDATAQSTDAADGWDLDPVESAKVITSDWLVAPRPLNAPDHRRPAGDHAGEDRRGHGRGDQGDLGAGLGDGLRAGRAARRRDAGHQRGVPADQRQPGAADERRRPHGRGPGAAADPPDRVRGRALRVRRRCSGDRARHPGHDARPRRGGHRGRRGGRLGQPLGDRRARAGGPVGVDRRARAAGRQGDRRGVLHPADQRAAPHDQHHERREQDQRHPDQAGRDVQPHRGARSDRRGARLRRGRRDRQRRAHRRVGRWPEPGVDDQLQRRVPGGLRGHRAQAAQRVVLPVPGGPRVDDLHGHARHALEEQHARTAR